MSTTRQCARGSTSKADLETLAGDTLQRVRSAILCPNSPLSESTGGVLFAHEKDNDITLSRWSFTMRQPRRNDSPSATDRLLEHDWSVMLYDGHCAICAGSARFIAARTRGRLLAFSAMQSDAGRATLRALGHVSFEHDTVLVLTQARAFHKSDAVEHLIEFLPTPWSYLGAALRLIPRGLRNAMYTFAARMRGHLTRRKPQCMLVVPEQARRFVR